MAVRCLMIATSACAAQSVQPSDASRPPADLGPCPGTSAKVQAACGCSPIDAHLLNRLRAFGFDESKVARASECASARLHVSAVGVETLGSEFVGCFERTVALDPEMRSTITRMVEASYAQTPPGETAVWQSCYERMVGANMQTEQASLRGMGAER